MDPLIGQRFLSVDPVTAYSPGGAFNQYWYAAANPYGLVDPDGRDPDPGMDPYRLSGGLVGVRSVGPVGCDACEVAGKGSSDIGKTGSSSTSSDSNSSGLDNPGEYWSHSSSAWADIGRGIWSPQIADPGYRIKGEFATLWLRMQMILRDGGSNPIQKIEADFIGLEIEQGMRSTIALNNGGDVTIPQSNVIHYNVFSGHGLPSNTYGGTPFGYAPSGPMKAWGDATSVLVNEIFGYCGRCTK